MSSGKVIGGIALSSTLYSDDIETFVKRFADVMKVNLSVFHFYLMENPDDEGWQEERIYDFGYTASCRLTVDCNQPSDKFYYEVFLPVHFPNEDEVHLMFYENGIVEFQFLTYDHTWWWFMENLYNTCVKKQGDRRVLDSIFQTKDLIEQILGQLAIDCIIYYGNYPYSFVDKLIYESMEVRDFRQILDVVRELDELAIIDFEGLLEGTINSDFPYEWLENKPNKVVLLHQLNRLQ